MDNRAILMRLQFLEIDRKRMLKEMDNLQPEQKDDLVSRVAEYDGRIMECKDWLEASKGDPGYGSSEKNFNGQWQPKLPTFVSKEEKEAKLANPEAHHFGLSDAEVKAARECRAAEDGEGAAHYLDGKGPYVS
jgi:hypothetical protein